MAEHVLEHLTESDVEVALSYIYQYLRREACFRIAVPDAYHPNPRYIEYVRPGGEGCGAADHKSFWNYNTLSLLLKGKGFSVNLLEYFNEEGKFFGKDFDDSNGKIGRRKSKAHEDKIRDYSSLIIDAVKPR